MSNTNLPANAVAATANLSPPHPLLEFWHYFKQNRGAVIGLVLVGILCLCALFAEWIAPHSAIEQFRESTLAPPAWTATGSSKFILGTDPVGRDILSRLIHGSRLSLFIGLVSVTLSMSVGVTLGLIAGFSRSWTGRFARMLETIIVRFMDILQALPSLLL
ncbi:MAG: dipeptide ABC transporter permease DppC, partial [Burkholderiales bacterium]|nr:dipeptide ABC transporter permease DppC [Burkholderiales bacterium]